MQDLLSLPLEFVPIHHIDTDITPFSFSYGFSLEPIILSIEKVGLINSPILKREEDKFVIVSGYKRVMAVKAIGWSRVGGRIIEHELSDKDCLLLNMYENILTRKLNDVEKSMLLKKLLRYIPLESVIKEYMPLLGLPRHKQVLDFYLWMAEELSEKAKILLVAGRLSIKSLHMFFDWDIPRSDRKIYLDLIENLKLSFNEQKQLIEYTVNICRKENLSLAGLLDEMNVHELISDKRLTVSNKAKRLMRLLKRRNFPELTKAEEKFFNKIRCLGLPKGVDIRPSPYFESPFHCLEIRFRDGKELKDKIEILNNIQGIEEIKEPWK